MCALRMSYAILNTIVSHIVTFTLYKLQYFQCVVSVIATDLFCQCSVLQNWMRADEVSDTFFIDILLQVLLVAKE